MAACDTTGEVVVDAAARALPPEHPLFQALRTGFEKPGESIKVKPLFDAGGQKIGALATFGNSTAGILKLLLESTGEGIFGIDTEGLCTFVNGSAAAMLGYRSAGSARQVHARLDPSSGSRQPMSHPASAAGRARLPR